jgi:hypothetical protein
MGAFGGLPCDRPQARVPVFIEEARNRLWGQLPKLTVASKTNVDSPKQAPVASKTTHPSETKSKTFGWDVCVGQKCIFGFWAG